MATTFTIKRNDTFPLLVANLQAIDTTPINLTTAASVRLKLKLATAASGASPAVNGLCAVTNAATGEVTYTWAVGDTLVSGNYQGEFEITWSTNVLETVPNDSYFSVVIIDDLG